jgi:hypothetical protein
MSDVSDEAKQRALDNDLVLDVRLGHEDHWDNRVGEVRISEFNDVIEYLLQTGKVRLEPGGYFTKTHKEGDVTVIEDFHLTHFAIVPN